MAAMLETPSRIWRRIEAIEDRDMPSLPSLPAFPDSDNDEFDSHDDSAESHRSEGAFPIHSTPAASSHHASTTSSASRFANSIARTSRSSTGRSSIHRNAVQNSRAIDSFDVSAIPSLPDIHPERGTGHYSEDKEVEQSKDSVPEVYLPPEENDNDDGLSLTDALELVSSPQRGDATPRKNYDYSVSLKSEPKPSPYDRFRNVALRRLPPARMRTPSLSRTSPSPTASPDHSTPRSNASLALPHVSPSAFPLPRSRTASPAIVVSRPDDDDDSESQVHEISYMQEGDDTGSMDITDVHISPLRVTSEEQQTEPEEDLREPTFSSEGGPTFQADQTQHARASPLRSPGVLSSPATSIAVTPTPAAPRPRARFNLASPPNNLASPPNNVPASPIHEEDENETVDDQVLTPHTRRRSFLLSVINSTARPRLKFPTPHPRHVLPTDSETDATPGPRIAALKTSGLQTAFAGATPRVPRRASHPLVNTYLAGSPATSDSEAGGGRISPAGWATPGPAHDGASIISTASSHDLTTHHYRANTSFDPAMGFNGAQALHGVGRFNAGKLNTYLHGLNRRLQEENETLVERVKQLQERQSDVVISATGATSRRTSLASTPLGNVAEDVAGEGWLEEKAELEELVDALKEEVEQRLAQLTEAEAALDEEKAGRVDDKESWKNKMREVEKGVNEHVGALEQRLESAKEAARQTALDAETQLEEIRLERDAAVERAAKAERLLEGDQELGGELREANERLGQALADLRNSNSQIKALEDEVMQADARLDDLEKELKDERVMTRGLEDELNAKTEEIAMLQQDHAKVEKELAATNEFVEELEQAVKEAVEQNETLQDQLAAAQEEMEQLHAADEEATEQVEVANGARDRADELARQLEDALEAAESTMRKSDEEIAQLKSRVASLERECERQRERSISSRDASGLLIPGPTEAEMNQLEEELDAANREIARLSTLLEQSPARKAIELARDTKIEMLERERDDLLERNKALRMTTATPNKFYNNSNISPIHRHVLSMSMRGPRTPGGPLRDMSWLNATAADGSVSPLLAEIQRLQQELDRANESIDDKLDKLEDNGLGVVGLTKRLGDAKAKIAFLEDEIARLSRREDRRLRRLERARCHKCLVKVKLDHIIQDESSMDAFNATLPSEPPTPPTKTTDALRSDLRSVNDNLTKMKKQWEEEKDRLLGEKAVLQDAANRLNIKVRTVEDEARQVGATKKTTEKLKAGIEGELEQARRTISDLEADLKAERSRLRSSSAEQTRAQRERENVLAQLQRTETDMKDVKQQLHRLKDENRELESELRTNATAEQKARLLEVRVSENAEIAEQLRQERSLLASDHKELQRKLTEITDQTNRLRAEYRTSQAAHDDRRHELDIQRAEIDDLRRALDGQADQLQRAEVEKDRLAAEKGDVARTVASLQSEIARVRREAEALGRDLKHLRSEKERLESKHKEESQKAERALKQSQTQLRVVTEQLEEQREKAARAKEDLKNHVCVMDDRQLSALKLQHNRECKGLMVHIRFLKAQVTRESSLRGALCYQKDYLLILLSKFERSERNIISSIARIGFPLSNTPPPRKQKRLKSVALTVIFLGRAKRVSDWWREQNAAKHAVRAALEEVRRNRAIAAP